MKNKEKFAKEILEIACSGDVLAVSKVTGKPISCKNTRCEDCNRCNDFSICEEKRLREWAESEYIEQPKISKKDRAFLDYIDNRFKYIARDEDGTLLTFEAKPLKVVAQKRINPLLMGGWMYALNRNMSDFNISFPMVKWSDAEPWLIENLKKLEVVEEYE